MISIGHSTSRHSPRDPSMGGLPLMDGKTAVPDKATECKSALLKMPDGSEIELPVLLGAAGDKFIDIRKLMPQ